MATGDYDSFASYLRSTPNPYDCFEDDNQATTTQPTTVEGAQNSKTSNEEASQNLDRLSRLQLVSIISDMLSQNESSSASRVRCLVDTELGNTSRRRFAHDYFWNQSFQLASERRNRDTFDLRVYIR